MNTPIETHTVTNPRGTITYEITRCDLFANWMTIMLRNRILRVFVPVALILNTWLVLGPGFSTRPLSLTLVEAILFIIGFLMFLVFVQTILALANAFLLEQRGIVGQHVLEITDQGLIERTDCNETLHRWSSIGRILSIGGYLYIYVGDNNSHQVPKRRFSPQEIDTFEADLRNHARQAGA